MGLLWPSPIDAVRLTLPEPPALEGALSVNDKLQRAKLLAEGQIVHPEDIAFDDAGRLYTGSSDGNIYRVTFDEADNVVDINMGLQEFAWCNRKK